MTTSGTAVLPQCIDAAASVEIKPPIVVIVLDTVRADHFIMSRCRLFHRCSELLQDFYKVKNYRFVPQSAREQNGKMPQSARTSCPKVPVDKCSCAQG